MGSIRDMKTGFTKIAIDTKIERGQDDPPVKTEVKTEEKPEGKPPELTPGEKDKLIEDIAHHLFRTPGRNLCDKKRKP